MSGRNVAAGLGLAAATTTGSLLIPTGMADAATSSAWDAVAKCESTNNWSINTGNGFFGGLQFTQSTWNEFGGRQFAPRADLATRQQQITIAEKVLAAQGKGAWPVCGKGLGSATSRPQPAIADVTVAKPITTNSQTKPIPRVRQQSPIPKAPQSQLPNPGSYAVVSGDTMWDIAHRFRVPLHTLIGINPQIRNPALIFAGDTVHLPGGVTVQVKPKAATKSPPLTQPTQATAPKVTANVTATADRANVHIGAVAAAKSFLGDPYLFGGTTARGLDCSALIQNAYKKIGIALPRTADNQMHATRTISRAQLQAGDLAFAVDSSGRAYHVAMYIGNGNVIEAPQPGQDVSIRPLYSSLTRFGRVIQ